jgi:hypothetical protein
VTLEFEDGYYNGEVRFALEGDSYIVHVGVYMSRAFWFDKAKGNR